MDDKQLFERAAQSARDSARDVGFDEAVAKSILDNVKIRRVDERETPPVDAPGELIAIDSRDPSKGTRASWHQLVSVDWRSLVAVGTGLVHGVGSEDPTAVLLPALVAVTVVVREAREHLVLDRDEAVVVYCLAVADGMKLDRPALAAAVERTCTAHGLVLDVCNDVAPALGRLAEAEVVSAGPGDDGAVTLNERVVIRRRRA